MDIVLDYVKQPELFNEVACHWADKISRTKSTQIRNFYDYVLNLYERSHTEPFSDILPFVKMLNSKVNYAKERKVASSEFVEMINNCVKQVNGPKQLELFKLFFEAVIGFSKK